MVFVCISFRVIMGVVFYIVGGERVVRDDF